MDLKRVQDLQHRMSIMDLDQRASLVFVQSSSLTRAGMPKTKTVLGLQDASLAPHYSSLMALRSPPS